MSAIFHTPRIVIFASGSGSNAENIVRHFRASGKVDVALIVCNNPVAEVVQRAGRLGVPVKIITKEELNEGGAMINMLQTLKADLIVLAGFLWLIPASLVRAYKDKILNVHPALLPRHGGKGMYGMKVHKAVLTAGDKESGISIHYVNEHFDEGKILLQAKCPVLPGDTPETLAARVHELEYAHYPLAISKALTTLSL